MRAAFLILTWLILTLVGLSRLSFNVEVTAMLPEDLPESVGIRHLYEHFSREDEIMITLSGPPGEEAAVGLEDAARSLAARLEGSTDLVDSVVWQMPFETHPERGADLLAWLWMNGPPDALASLAASLEPSESPGTLASVIEDLETGFIDEQTLIRSYDPLGLTALPGGLEKNLGAEDALFVSEDGSFRVLYVMAPRRDFEGYREVDAWVEEIRREIAVWQADREGDVPGAAEISVGLTGEPAFVAEISTAMESDMRGSMLATTLLIVLMFWLWYRRVRPLLWLVLMLGLVFSATFAVGGLIFGQLSAMSIGFAAILLGLVVDYGVVLFRERHVAGGDPRRLRRIMGPSIVWAALTTGAVFAILKLSSLPGIAELGLLVAIGTGLGALVMMVFFVPVVARDGRGHAADPGAAENEHEPVRGGGAGRTGLVVFGFTGLVLLAGVLTLVLAGPPGLGRDVKPFQLRHGKAEAALEEMQRRLDGAGDGGSSLPVIVTADSWRQLAARMRDAEHRLAGVRDDGMVQEFLLPTALVPEPEHQESNRKVLRRLVEDGERLVEEEREAGFADEGTALTRGVIAAWEDLLARERPEGGDVVLLPEGEWAWWIIGRAVSGHGGGDGTVENGARDKTMASHAAVGRVRTKVLTPDEHRQIAWTRRVNAPGIQVTGWEVLNPLLQSLVAGDFVRVFFPMGCVLILMLALVFRKVRDLLLALGSLAFSGLALMTLTRWIPGAGWNTFNMAAVPILFGTGLDYSIHMIFALRRSGGALAPVRRGISQALVFCGLSTAVGFGSLAFASSEGLSSLGLVCALGIILNMLSAIWLLPHWWRRWERTFGELGAEG